MGWVIWRSKEYLPESIVFHVNYLGSDQASVTLNFSRGAGMIIAQYYQVPPAFSSVIQILHPYCVLQTYNVLKTPLGNNAIMSGNALILH